MGIFSSKLRGIDSDLMTGDAGWIPVGSYSHESNAGPRVHEKSVMSLSAMWCGVNFISSTKASLPLHVYKKTKTGREIAKNYPIDTVLHVKANPLQDAFVFIETLAWMEILTGHAYAEIVRNGYGEIIELWPIPTWRVTPKVKGRSISYDVTVSGHGTKTLSSEQMLHIQGPYGGASILEMMCNTFGLSMAIDKFAATFFKRGGHPGIVVRHPKTLTPTAHKKLEGSLDTKYGGLGNAFRLVLLDEGMEAQKMLHSLEENQLVGLKQLQVVEVARILNLPPHVLKDLTKSAFSNIEKQSIELVVYSLLPRVRRYESVFNAFLIPKEDQDDYAVYFNIKGLLRGDDKARAEYYTKMRRLGALNVNEIRRLEDMNTIGAEGDIYHVSADLIPLDMAGQQQKGSLKKAEKSMIAEFTERVLSEKREPSTTEADLILRDKKADRFFPLIRRASQKIVNIETRAVKNAVKKASGARADFDFDAWMRRFYEKFPKYINENLRELLGTYGEEVNDLVCNECGTEPEVTAEVQADIDDYIDGFVSQYIDASIGQIVTLSETDGIDSIADRMDEWFDTRAEKVASRQVISMANMVAATVIFNAGYKLVWIARSKACPWCKQMNGRVIKEKNASFVKAGTELEGDDERPSFKVKNNVRYPQLHGGCKCAVGRA